MELPKKKYQLIYADPPWRYNFASTKTRKIENQYPTMELESIKEIPIEKISDKDCVLYLWATAPKLIEALDVIEAWGFKYKTHCIWDKEIIGMGYWFRGMHELLLVATKGKVSPPSPSKRVGSIITHKRTKHSKKPDKIRNLLSGWFPYFNKIELFARERTEGWDSWGNELSESIKSHLPLSQNQQGGNGIPPKLKSSGILPKDI